MGRVKDSIVVIELMPHQVDLILQALDDREQYLYELVDAGTIDQNSYDLMNDECNNTYNIIQEYSKVHDAHA